jgi:putative heme iron utilization protein
MNDHEGAASARRFRWAPPGEGAPAPDPRASILLAESGKGDPLAHPRLTVIGRLERCPDPRVRERFLARHPKARLYADFVDFSFFP